MDGMESAFRAAPDIVGDISLAGATANGPGTRIPDPVELIERSFRSMNASSWDGFACCCGASFMSAWPVIRLRRLMSRVVVIEFYRGKKGGGTKIAQCAVAIGRSEVRFLDRLLLLPEHAEEWSACMRALVDRFGARTYRYGSHWNEEAARKIDPSACYVAHQVWSRDFHVDAVDLAGWTDFDHYSRSVSHNIRRDLVKAAKSGNARVTFRQGFSAVRDLPALTTARAHMMRKNRQSLGRVGDTMRHLFKLAAFGDRAFIASASLNGKTYAALFMIEFGDCLYYVSGGVLPNEAGLGSLLMLKVIELWYAKHPRGRLVMGFTTGQKRPEDYTEGALLYRRKLRVSSRNGLEFSTTVHPGFVAARNPFAQSHEDAVSVKG